MEITLKGNETIVRLNGEVLGVIPFPLLRRKIVKQRENPCL